MTAAVLLLRVKCIWSASHTTAHKANDTSSFTLSSYASRHARPKIGRNLPAAVPCRVEAFACSAQQQSTRFASLDHHTPCKRSEQASRARTPRHLSFAACLALLAFSSVLRAVRRAKAKPATPRPPRATASHHLHPPRIHTTYALSPPYTPHTQTHAAPCCVPRGGGGGRRLLLLG